MKVNRIDIVIRLLAVFFVTANASYAQSVIKEDLILPAFNHEAYGCGTAKQLVMQRLPGDNHNMNITLNASEGAQLRGDPALIAGQMPGSIFVFNGKINILPCDEASRVQAIVIDGDNFVFKLNEENRLVYVSGQGKVVIDGKTTLLGDPTTESLVIASEKGHADRVKQLLDKGADVNEKSAAGIPALLFAAFNNHTDIVKLLLDKGADVNAKDKSGNVALMGAVFGSVEMVKVLLSKGADVNAKNESGKTALMGACFGDIEIVKLLLDKGADVNVKDADGQTALMFASKNNHPDVVNLLRVAGAKE
ncbi:MAG: ankyrin repeat domain-containing protein [Candidatus Omnitrophica bacterium]|nr:ankyrin repeat domain-containing protein [Candidatus Omnitrophota bacterium]